MSSVIDQLTKVGFHVTWINALLAHWTVVAEERDRTGSQLGEMASALLGLPLPRKRSLENGLCVNAFLFGFLFAGLDGCELVCVGCGQARLLVAELDVARQQVVGGPAQTPRKLSKRNCIRSLRG